MPEGPECRRITDKLRASVKGKTFLWMDFFNDPNSKSTKYLDTVQPTWLQVQNKFPSVCTDMICRGKQLFFFFENGICFFGGLGMEGHWYRFNKPEDEIAYRKRSLPNSTDKTYPKFCLHFGRTSGFDHPPFTHVDMSEIQLWYDDQRNFGNFSIGTWQDGFTKMSELGPDLLAVRAPIENIHPVLKRSLPQTFFDQLTFEQFVQILRTRDLNICKVLLDATQKKLSGIGNYLKSEILYRAKISPFRTTYTLTNEELSTLYGITINTIYQAYQAGGLTHGTFLDPDFEKGTFDKIIYRRENELDPNGFVIQYTKDIDGRGTFYVPEVQR